MLALVLAAPAPRAQGVLPADRALTQAVLDTWGRPDGLPQLSVRSLAQTPDGYLWLGTQEGLARFDGVAFETFDATLGDLPNNTVTALHVDAAGTLWVATRGGMARYQDGAFRVLDGATADTYVFSIAEDEDGSIWAGLLDGTVARFDGTAFTPLALPDSLSGTHISALARRDGVLWIGTNGRGLWRYANGQLAPVGSSLAEAHVTSLLPDGEALWVGTLDDGLHRIRDGRARSLPEASDVRVRTLYQDPAGTLWIGAESGGLVRYTDGALSTLTDAQGLPHKTVRSILSDHEGSLWVGTEGGGLARLRAGKFVTWGTPEGVASDYVFSVVEDEAGALWFATEAGLSRLQNGAVTSVEGLPGDYVMSLSPAAGGGVWAGFRGAGLALVRDGRVATHLTDTDGLPAPSVFGLYTDAAGTLWIATSNGLGRLHEGVLTTFTEDDGLSNNLITAMGRDANGHLVVGTYEAGLTVLDIGATGGVRSARTVGVEDGLEHPAVLSIHVGAAGTIWVGTNGGGLTRIGPDGSLHTLRARDGLPSDNILQPLEDGRGNLWLSTNRGLGVVSLEAIQTHAGGTPALPVTVYEEPAGLRTREFNGGVQPAGWRDGDGTLWFGSASGAVAVRPGQMPTNAVAPIVHVDGLRADGEPVALTNEIRLAPGTRRLAITFTALSFIASRDLPFRYRLSGVDAEWVEAGTIREADYTNLEPGHYTFEVQAANLDGVWSETPDTLVFELEPFFTQTLWFKALLVFATLALLALAYVWRVRTLKARQRGLERVVEARTRDLRIEKENVETERARAEAAHNRSESAWARAEGAKAIIEAQAYELVEANDALRDANGQLAETSEVKSHLMRVVAHDLNNPLGVIMGYTDVLREVTDPEGEAPEMIQVIENAAGDMLALVQRFLGAEAIDDGRLALHTRALDLGAAARASAERFGPSATRKEQTIAVSTLDDATILADRDWIKEVLDNLVSNAVKYTPRGRRIWVDVVEAGAAFQVRVRDEGPGLTDEDKSKLFGRFQRLSAQPTGNESSTGLGLSIVKKIVELHGGRVWAESRLGEGTTFVVEFAAHVEAEADLSDDGTLALV